MKRKKDCHRVTGDKEEGTKTGRKKERKREREKERDYRRCAENAEQGHLGRGPLHERSHPSVYEVGRQKKTKTPRARKNRNRDSDVELPLQIGTLVLLAAT